MAAKTMKPRSERWVGLLGDDPRSWLLASEEPAARFVVMTELLDSPADDPEVESARAAVLADQGTKDLIGRLPDWDAGVPFSGHQSPGFAPNILQLLADMGVRGDDDLHVERLLDQMLDHQEPNGRFASFGTSPVVKKPAWGSVLCDTHAITEVLVRYGRAEDPRTVAALQRMTADLAETTQGRAWPCVPSSVGNWRGPGRKADFCPQVTLEALRTFARLPAARRPPGLIDVARVSLRAWRVRHEEKPYMFGHGRRFATAKWPQFWYDANWVLDTLGRYPALWRGAKARPEDRAALAEIAASLIAANFGPDGRVTPRSCYKGFEAFSFGQKKRPSPFATARLCTVLRRVDDLAPDIAAADVNQPPKL
ncbi:MAG: hypothetical protein WDA71_04545 [Actinomycetota bacterium]